MKERIYRLVFGLIAGVALRLASEFCWEHRIAEASGMVVLIVACIGIALLAEPI